MTKDSCCPSWQPQTDISRTAEKFAALCKALAHPARVEILKHLITVDRCICGEIVEVMPLAQSTVSQHLKILRKSGLVQGEVEGPRSCYCVNREALERFQAMASALLAEQG